MTPLATLYLAISLAHGPVGTRPPKAATIVAKPAPSRLTVSLDGRIFELRAEKIGARGVRVVLAGEPEEILFEDPDAIDAEVAWIGDVDGDGQLDVVVTGVGQSFRPLRMSFE